MFCRKDDQVNALQCCGLSTADAAEAVSRYLVSTLGGIAVDVSHGVGAVDVNERDLPPVATPGGSNISHSRKLPLVRHDQN